MSAAQDEFNELMRDKERRTQHPEDDEDDARSFLNLSDEDDDDDATPPASQVDPDEAPSRPSLSSRHTIPLTRYEANTGPKGVIADAQHFRDSRRQHRVSVRSTSTLASQALNGSSLHDRPTSEKLQESDEEEEEVVLNDDFMKQWRSSRLREMQRGGWESKMHSRRPSRRMWGSLATVDGEGYLDAVDKSPADTVVVVYIYDDYSDVSSAIETCLRQLARRHVDTRFVKLHHVDAEMEPAGTPALLAYRGGDKFAGLVPIINEIPDDADLSDVVLENLLRRHQILR
ncbi:hypothetical protein B0A55_06951 [Friedmanniomyces simplex]|uniref:Phosducin domain-containing protein n=1 Tax=Friedmanniomyces simplex TaxID=329884 RepID=A0A4U0WZQ7_9PEZI|nr:hypothetical protein B0A55_06951 [Friedmanniomyces simplex]